MSSFYEKVMAGWSAALESGSTAVEKLDALAWPQINVLERFSDEFKIQLAWMRQSPRAALIHARDTVVRGVAAR